MGAALAFSWGLSLSLALVVVMVALHAVGSIHSLRASTKKLIRNILLHFFFFLLKNTSVDARFTESVTSATKRLKFTPGGVNLL